MQYCVSYANNYRNSIKINNDCVFFTELMTILLKGSMKMLKGSLKMIFKPPLSYTCCLGVSHMCLKVTNKTPKMA